MVYDKTPRIEEEARERISEFFPEALRRAIESYKEFMEHENSGPAKDFKEHHTAAKVAISHIELLIKLGEWAQLQGRDTADEDILRSIMAEAEAELKAYQESERESHG